MPSYPKASASRLEALISNITNTIPISLRLYHPSFSPMVPANTLLDILPNSSLLALRRVSQKTKTWVDILAPTIFSSLRLSFPLHSLSDPSTSALHRISPYCRYLTISVLSSSFSAPAPLPPLPLVAYLHLLPTISASFHPVFALRLLLQSSTLPMLTHITLDPITLDDILALRWGPFSSFGDANWMDAKIWRGIKSLGIGLVPWWGDIAGYKKTEDTAQRQQQKERWRVGVKVLHDWIGSFGVGLERIIFEWKGAEGPNPLLLDIVAARRGIGRWFSAPEVKWKGLREVWLGACWIGREEIFELMERMGQLEILMVWKGWVGAGINGTVKMVDGREWVEVSWGDDEVSRLNEMTMVEIGKAAMGDLQMPGNVGLREVVGKVAGASENMEDDDSFAWSDDSMVVPFVLHT